MNVQEIAAMMWSKNLSNLFREEAVLVVQKAQKAGINSVKWKMMLSKGKETWLKYTQNCEIFCLTLFYFQLIQLISPVDLLQYLILSL